MYGGRVRIGWLCSGGSVSVERHVLKVESPLLGRFGFSPEQVIAFETFPSVIAFLGEVRVKHNVPEYPRTISFAGSVDEFLREARERGFEPKGASPLASRPGPLRPTAMLLLVGSLLSGAFAIKLFQWTGVLALLAFLFASSMVILSFPAVHRGLLRPGRSIVEIRHLVRAVALLAGFGLISVTLLYLSGNT